MNSTMPYRYEHNRNTHYLVVDVEDEETVFGFEMKMLQELDCKGVLRACLLYTSCCLLYPLLMLCDYMYIQQALENTSRKLARYAYAEQMLGQAAATDSRFMEWVGAVSYTHLDVYKRQHPLYEFKECGEEENGRVRGELKATGNKLENTQKAEAAGLWKQGQERLPENGQNAG